MTDAVTIGPCHIRTPLIHSPKLSKQSGHNIYLKLDNLQPSGSFKIRGIGRSVQVAYATYGPSVQILSSSGGNAGLAAATASRIMGLKCTVYCPETTSDHTVALLQAEDAVVVRKGAAFDDANANALEAVKRITETGHKAVLVHPFLGEPVVEGAATMVEEIYEQLEEDFGFGKGYGPDYVSCVVGGGGLLNGVLTGLIEQHSKSSSPYPPATVLGVQCFGANAFSESRKAGKLVTLPAITSKATSMGALTCSPDTLAQAANYESKAVGGKFITIDVTDQMAASGSWKFARDHRLLVELSCGAALAPVYFADRFKGTGFGNDARRKNIVIIVCGGSKDSLQDVYSYEEQEKKTPVHDAKIHVDGREIP